MPNEPLRLSHAVEMSAIDAPSWNRLAGDSPFLRHEFLAALEDTGCVGGDTSWQPHHLLLHEDAALVAALPLYIRYDSSGEFVFDWGWAHAYQQAGLDYYPKLVSAVPFTPATGQRLLIDAARIEPETAAERLLDGARDLCRRLDASSLHVLFPTSEEQRVLAKAGLHGRKGCQFHWHNRGYADFDAFLATFTSAKRKKAKRERRRIAEANIVFEHLRGDELDDADWDAVYDFYSRTFLRRGRLPYLNREFFTQVGQTMPESVVVILARYERKPIAAAICFRSRNTLFGRYWGSLADFHSLHFEACYYQGIDYCIRHRLSRFEPGTQGEHKISRGFVPTATWSSHWLCDSGFDRALRDLLIREESHVDAYMIELNSHLPYRQAGNGLEHG